MNGYCNLPEVELTFVAAIDLGQVGTRVFLRCTDINIPTCEEPRKEENG